MVKRLPIVRETQVQSLGREDSEIPKSGSWSSRHTNVVPFMTVSCSHQFSCNLAFSLFCACLKPLDGRGAVTGQCVSNRLGDACRDPVWSLPQLWTFQRSGHKACKVFLVGGFRAMSLPEVTVEACQVQGGAGTILLLCLGGWGCAQAGGVAAVEEVVVGAFSSVWPGSSVTCHQPEKTWLPSGLLLPPQPSFMTVCEGTGVHSSLIFSHTVVREAPHFCTTTQQLHRGQ